MLNDKQLLNIVSQNQQGVRPKVIAKAYGITSETVRNFLNKKGKYFNVFWTKYNNGEFGTDHHLDELIETTPDAELAKVSRTLRSVQKRNNLLARQLRACGDNGNFLEEALEGVVSATEALLGGDETIKLDYRPQFSVKNATLEILFSDLQIGKVSRFYNTPIAKEAVRKYCLGIMETIVQRETMYNIERIVFAMVGDVVEDHLKHGPQSSISTDTGLAEQMHDAIECVWKGLLQPLGALGIPMDVICITGNHGSSQHKGMDAFKAGRYSYDFVIHHTLRRYCELSGFEHVTFNIPDGTFGYMDIYGKIAIYEHGYHNPCSEKGMTEQMMKRGQQIGKHVSFWRQGDKHHHAAFGQGQQVLNGAFFGIETEGIEYSGILGFNSIPSQTIMFHTDEADALGSGNIREVLNIQVGQTAVTVD